MQWGGKTVELTGFIEHVQDDIFGGRQLKSLSSLRLEQLSLVNLARLYQARAIIKVHSIFITRPFVVFDMPLSGCFAENFGS